MALEPNNTKSTTRMKQLFGSLEFWIVVLAGISAVLAFFMSEPKKTRTAACALAIIVLMGLLVIVEKRRSIEINRSFRQTNLRRIEVAFGHHLQMLRDAIYMASESDKPLPTNRATFFSNESAAALATLDLSTDAHMLPRRTWRLRLQQGTEELMDELGHFCDQPLNFDSAEARERFLELKDSTIFAVFRHLEVATTAQRELGVTPVDFLGSDIPWTNYFESLDKVVGYMQSAENDLDLRIKLAAGWETNVFDMANSRRWPDKLRGSSYIFRSREPNPASP